MDIPADAHAVRVLMVQHRAAYPTQHGVQVASVCLEWISRVVLGAVYACVANHGAVARTRSRPNLGPKPDGGSDDGVVTDHRMELCIICSDCVASQECPGTATFVVPVCRQSKAV